LEVALTEGSEDVLTVDLGVVLMEVLEDTVDLEDREVSVDVLMEVLEDREVSEAVLRHPHAATGARRPRVRTTAARIMLRPPRTPSRLLSPSPASAPRLALSAHSEAPSVAPRPVPVTGAALASTDAASTGVWDNTSARRLSTSKDKPLPPFLLRHYGVFSRISSDLPRISH